MTYIEQRLPESGDTVLVGMSGGVDSTLTALLLKQKGCRVIGVTMSLWDGSLPDLRPAHPEKPVREACYGPGEEENIEECRRFCAERGIEYHVIDVRETYQRKVLDYFKAEYRSGRTPNPCVMCNQNVKFGAMLEGAERLGIRYDYFCTGHYAKIVRPETGVFGSEKRPCMIACAADTGKDQTYFLYRVPSGVLEKVRFPLASMKKAEVLRLAREARLDAAGREESQDFAGGEYFDMIFSDSPGVEGDIVDLDGRVLGRHRGIEHYTVGQRRGLGVAVNYPVYVHSIDAESHTVVLAPNDALYSAGLIADSFVWPADVEPDAPFECEVKIRLASRPVLCRAERDSSAGGQPAGGSWRITFESPQRAVAPGQSAVLYRDGVIVGGGIIRRGFGGGA